MDANAILAGVVMGQSPAYEPHQFRAIFHTVIACAWYNPSFPLFPLPATHALTF